MTWNTKVTRPSGSISGLSAGFVCWIRGHCLWKLEMTICLRRHLSYSEFPFGEENDLFDSQVTIKRIIVAQSVQTYMQKRPHLQMELTKHRNRAWCWALKTIKLIKRKKILFIEFKSKLIFLKFTFIVLTVKELRKQWNKCLEPLQLTSLK